MVESRLALGATVVVLGAFSAIGLWYSAGRVRSIEDFISARGTAGGGTLTATLIASSMGAWILFSPAEAGAAFGGITAVFGYAAGSALPLLAYVVVGPRIREYLPDGHSLTEYAYARYGRAMYAYVLVVSVLYMFIFLAAEMTGITGALELVAGVPRWQTAAVVGLFVLSYTVYGGLQASIFTDTIQTLVILPLLAVGFGGALLALGGPGEIHASVAARNPSLLDPGFVTGLQFGGYVAIAVLGAEMLNQAWWQRIYAAESDRTLRRSFLVAAVAVVPMILVAGLFGLAATGLDAIVTDPTSAGYNADVAFFLVVDSAFPAWVALAVVLLAILLVMSTADTLFNAIASVVTADLPTLLDDPDDRTLTLGARGLTVAVALAATLVGAQGYSVLRIFLTADLLAAATFLPLLYGLFSSRPGGHGMLVASVSGLLVGLAFFPTLRGLVASVPGVGPLLPAPDFLLAFAGAAFVSGGLAVVFALLTPGRFDLDDLGRDVRRLDDAAESGEVSD
ncbi:sodium:solute symporter family transporter [Halorientalis marina]|jgi:Na+/proline symporter|uniref:sodium:solute symporter family transporter n=1 Tax=Halorientalis marina TaxID=2931976 RepID=UPI001FF60315|nr:sodium:proline symporter [Halorientalis marina]